MRDYFAFTKRPSIKDIPFLKIGRHFRLDSGDKVIVARNEHECKMLRNLCHIGDHLLVPVDFSGLSVILQGSSLEVALEKMLQFTKRAVPERARIVHFYKGKNRSLFLSEMGLRS